MINLLPHEQDAFQRLARDGALPMREVGISIAIRLEMAGFAKIGGVPQVVAVTEQGAGHARRSAH